MSRQMKDRTLYEPLEELDFAGKTVNEMPGMVDIRSPSFVAVPSGRAAACEGSRRAWFDA
jgi:hypothetical protein